MNEGPKIMLTISVVLKGVQDDTPCACLVDRIAYNQYSGDKSSNGQPCEKFEK